MTVVEECLNQLPVDRCTHAVFLGVHELACLVYVLELGA